MNKGKRLPPKVLDRTREVYQYIFEESPALNMVIGMDGIIRDVNKAVTADLGYTRRDVLGRDILSFVAAHDRESTARHLQKALRGEKNPEIKVEVLAADGSPHTLLISKNQARLYEGGAPVGVLIVGVDITENIRYKEALRTEETRYRMFFENTGTAMMIAEADMTIALANREFEELIGFPRDEVVGTRPWTDFVSPDDVERMKEFHRLRRENTGKAPHRYEFRLIDRGGSVKDVMVSVSLIPETERSIASLIDITDLRRAEKALAEKNLELLEKNAAMRQLTQQVSDERDRINQNIAVNIEHLLLPLIRKIKLRSPDSEHPYFDVLEENLERMTAGFGKEIIHRRPVLTQKEIQICNLIRGGLSSKEIADLAHVSLQTVHTHRRNIRKKLNIHNKRVNLTSYLNSLDDPELI